MTSAPQPQHPADEFIIKREELERVEAACRNEYGEYIGQVNDEFFDCIYSRPTPSPEFTPYIPGKEQPNTYRCCEVCPNVLAKPVFRVNCLQPQHDAAIAAQARDKTLTDVLLILNERAMIDENNQYYLWLEDAECAVESLRGDL